MGKKRNITCTKCNQRHEAPAGRKCARVLNSTTIEEPIDNQSQADSSPNVSVGRDDRILSLLQDIRSRQDRLDDRLQAVETASVAGSPVLSRPSASRLNQPQQRVNEFYADGIVPTIDALRGSDQIQRDVAARLRDLENGTIQQGNLLTQKPLKSGRFWGADGPVVKTFFGLRSFVLWGQLGKLFSMMSCPHCSL